MKRGRFRGSVFLGALALSLIFHFCYVIPDLLAPLLEKPEAPLEVAYVPDEELKPPEPLKVHAPKKRRAAEEQRKVPLQAKKAPPPQPRPLPAVPVPPPQPVPDHRMQMVDQNRFPNEADNPDAHYLAEENHRTLKETRAKNTNLLHNVASPNQALSQPNKNHSSEVGAASDKIAELKEHKGSNKALPRSQPLAGNPGKSRSAHKPGPLAMRDLIPRAATTQKKGQLPREGLEMQQPGVGDLPMERVGRDAERGSEGQAGAHANLNLDSHSFDEIEGFAAAEAQREQAARAESSHKAGRYDRYLAQLHAMQSSLENFTPDVRPGNQEELGTRASPFAAYITAMHRQIHQIWTFGFLTDLELHRNSMYDDDSLWTQLEIVVNGNGTLDKVTIVRTSGLTPFDVAAIASVTSAAPFPAPPAAIKSRNGKVYMDWQFHRDERACGTFGVDPYILSTPGQIIEHDRSETGMQSHALFQSARAQKRRRPLASPLSKERQ